MAQGWATSSENNLPLQAGFQVLHPFQVGRLGQGGRGELAENHVAVGQQPVQFVLVGGLEDLHVALAPGLELFDLGRREAGRVSDAGTQDPDPGGWRIEYPNSVRGVGGNQGGRRRSSGRGRHKRSSRYRIIAHRLLLFCTSVAPFGLMTGRRTKSPVILKARFSAGATYHIVTGIERTIHRRGDVGPSLRACRRPSGRRSRAGAGRQPEGRRQARRLDPTERRPAS